MSKGKQLAKNTLFYAVGNFGSKVLTFLIVPLYTYYIDTDSMGTYDAIITAVSLLSPVIVWSIYEGVYRWTIQKPEAAGQYVKFGLFIEIRNLLIACLLVFAVGYFVKIPYLEIVVLYTFASCVHNYLQRITRALGNTKFYAAIGFTYTIIYLACNLIFIIPLKLGVISLFLSAIAGSVLTSVVMLYVQRENIFYKDKDGISNQEKKELIKYSLAITPNDICWWIVGLSDRFALIYFVSTSSNGIYAISQKFPTIITMITTIFYMAWQDQSVSYGEGRDKDGYYTRVFKLYSRGLFCACLILIPFTKICIQYLMESSYKQAWYYVMPLYIGSIYSALASFLGVGYQIAKKTIHALSTTGVAAIVNIVINLVFMPLFPEHGIWVASISTMISYFTLYLARRIQVKKYMTVHINKLEIFILTFVNILAGIFVLYTNIYLDLILLAFGLVISWFYLHEYISNVTSFLKKKIQKKV